MERPVVCTNPFSIVPSIGTPVSCVSGHYDGDEKDNFDDDGEKEENGGVDDDHDDGKPVAIDDDRVSLKNVMLFVREAIPREKCIF